MVLDHRTCITRFILAEGLLELQRDWIVVSPMGRLLVRVVCAVFDRYLREREARAEYSKVNGGRDKPVPRVEGLASAPNSWTLVSRPLVAFVLLVYVNSYRRTIVPTTPILTSMYARRWVMVVGVP